MTKMKSYIFFLICILFLASCKSGKNPQTDVMTEEEERELLRKQALGDQPIEKAGDAQYENLDTDLPNEGQEHFIRSQKSIPDSLIARIQRTACFGRCPIYTISLYKSGFATYNGEKWVEHEGFYGAFVGLNVIKTIQNMAEEINYLELNDIYDSRGVTDVPSTITTLRVKDQVKVVVNRFDAPEKLIKFEKLFDSLFKDVKWDKELVQSDK